MTNKWSEDSRSLSIPVIPRLWSRSTRSRDSRMMLRSGVKPKDDKKTHNSSASKVPLPRKTWGKNMGNTHHQIFDQWIAGTWNNLSGRVLIKHLDLSQVFWSWRWGLSQQHSFTKLFDPSLRAVPSVWGYEKNLWP